MIVSVLFVFGSPIQSTNTRWYLKSHPHARRFRNQPFPEWFDLQTIFGTVASGKHTQSLSQRLLVDDDHAQDKSSDESSGICDPVNRARQVAGTNANAGMNLLA